MNKKVIIGAALIVGSVVFMATKGKKRVSPPNYNKKPSENAPLTTAQGALLPSKASL